VAAVPRRPPQPCVICGDAFHPRHARTRTCSPACKAALLSKRTTEHYARLRAA
jgi:predicted nucleic acid-binding Zn ribbon protein